DLSAFCKPSGSSAVFDPAGGLLNAPPADPPATFAANGAYWSEALDSQFYRCQWHRIVLHGKLSPKTSISVATFTSEIEQALDQIQTMPEKAWTASGVIKVMAEDCETLIFSGPGRYLWLRLQFTGNGSATPSVESIKLEFPRISLRRYLPAVFAE